MESETKKASKGETKKMRDKAEKAWKKKPDEEGMRLLNLGIKEMDLKDYFQCSIAL